MSRYSFISQVLQLLIPKAVANRLVENKRLTDEEVRRRLAMGHESLDFVEVMVSRGVTRGEVRLEYTPYSLCQ